MVSGPASVGQKATILFSDNSNGKFRLFLSKETEAPEFHVNFEAIGIPLASGSPLTVKIPIEVNRWALIWLQIQGQAVSLAVQDSNGFTGITKQESYPNYLACKLHFKIVNF